MVDETGIVGNIRVGICSRSLIETWLVFPCLALSCADKGNLLEEGLPPPRVVTSTSLRLDLGMSVRVTVEKDRSVGSLAKGSATDPPKNLDAGRSSRSGVTLPPEDRKRRRRKQNNANPHASKPTAPPITLPAIVATLLLQEISIHA